MIDRTIRNFEIKELIATGGMAAIYKAIQISLERVVAIKILHGHLAQDKNFITRFEREAKAAANLKHENIVNIIDYGKAEEAYFIAMEYVDGMSLKDVMASIKFLPYDLALALCLQIVQGLEHAHAKGVVHRDIKPANILISKDGVVKIADFGLAQAQDLTSVTVTGSIVGTPAYMSPEQAGGKKVDARTDIFSLGVVVYEMITGNKPFTGDNYSSVIHEILTVTPPKPVVANPLIPQAINDIIEKMLAKDVEKRYQTVGQVKDDIKGYFKARNIEIRSSAIWTFISAPDKQLKELLAERKGKHFERGLHFMKSGDNKVEDAISEFKKVIHLDPADERANAYLIKLKERKKKIASTGDEIEVSKTPQKRTSSLLPVGLIGGIIIIGVAILLLATDLKNILLPPTAKESGFLYIITQPSGARVSLDGKATGDTTPVYMDGIGYGAHWLTITKSGYEPFTDSFSIVNKDTFRISAELVKETVTQKFGTIAVRSQPSKAAVYLDGANTNLFTPCTVEKVAEGEHTVRVVKKGYKDYQISKTVHPDKELQVSAVLRKEDATSPPTQKQYSYLKITVKPWAKIYIDGKYVETTPIAKSLRISSGTHEIKLENPNFKTWQKTVSFKPNQTKTINVALTVRDGFLKLTVRPWADVYLDGRFYETTPIAKPIKLSAGKHTLKLVNPSYKQFVQVIDIPPNKMLNKFVELEPK